MDTHPARLLLDKIAEGTWLCGDPGMQYEDTIQKWHTCPNTAPINSSNPCVTGETLVSTAEGYRRIGDLVGQELILVDRHGVRRPIQNGSSRRAASRSTADHPRPATSSA